MKILRYLFLYIPLCFILISLGMVLLYKWVPVPVTPLMVVRMVENRGDTSFHTRKEWKPLSEISKNMTLAVMAGEDNRFLEHNGFDWEEINNAIEDSRKGKRLRGASTISQQTAKNVFLLPGRSWMRKGLEVYFTSLIELIWGKERIMEVYLNVAEMGRGIYGASAAAEHFFKIEASKLNVKQSALIAATLPNPLRRRADKPSGYVMKRAGQIERLMFMIERPQWAI